MKNTLRWYAKKAARKAMALGSCGTGSLDASAHAGASTRVRVLTYHRFGDSPHDPFSVDLKTFDAQMETLATAGLAVSLDDLERSLRGDAQLPDGAVLVTIDDGFVSLHDGALPILSRHGIPAVAYVSPGLMDGGDVIEIGPEARLSWQQLAELSRNRVAIGSHAWSHRSLGSMDAETVRNEAQRSRERLEERLGVAVTSFAYPFGTRADFNDPSRDILEECGYATAFTSQHGAVCGKEHPLELPRVKVEGGEALWMFKLLIRGGLDGWRWVDRTLWRLQANHGPSATTG